MSDTTARNETVTAWAPYIAIIVTIVVTVGGAAWGMAWSIGGGQAQLGAKIDAVEATLEAKIDAAEAKVDAVEAKVDAVEARLEAKIDGLEARLEAKIEANAEAIREVLDAVEVNRQAIAANSAKIERLDGRLDEHRNVHAEHERRHELAAAPAAR